jgi:uncharacterized membrane protein YbhN (UPF0104 family)
MDARAVAPAPLRAWLPSIVKWAVVIGLVSYLVASGKLNARQLRPTWDTVPLYGLAVLSLCAVVGLVSIRHWLLLRALGISVKIREVVKLGLIGAFFNTFLLGGMGGDLVKVAYLARGTHELARPAASVMMDRGLGLVALFLLGCGAFLLDRGAVATGGLQTLKIATFGVLGTISLSVLVSVIALARGRAMGAVAWLLCVSLSAWAAATRSSGLVALTLLVAASVSLGSIALVPSCQPGGTLEGFVRHRIPFGGQVMGLVQAVLAYRGALGSLFLALTLALLAQAGTLLTLFLLARTVSKASLVDVLFAGPTALVANQLPVPGGGLGVGELAFDSTLGLCRTPAGDAVTGGAEAFVLFRLFLIATGLLGLPIYLRGRVEFEQATGEYRHLVGGRPEASKGLLATERGG